MSGGCPRTTSRTARPAGEGCSWIFARWQDQVQRPGQGQKTATVGRISDPRQMAATATATGGSGGDSGGVTSHDQ